MLFFYSIKSPNVLFAKRFLLERFHFLFSFLFFMEQKIADTKGNLLKIKDICKQFLALNAQLHHLLYSDDDLRQTGAAELLSDESGLQALETYGMVAVLASLEAEEWEQIKDMTDKERGNYFLSKSRQEKEVHENEK